MELCLCYDNCFGPAEADTGSGAGSFQIGAGAYYQMEPWIYTSECAPYFLCHPFGFYILSRAVGEKAASVGHCYCISV